MFLERIRERNPMLLQAATRLHQGGAVPANTWVIDLDVIADNASILAKEAGEQGLATYVMTKQFARNPMVTRVALERGLGAPVAVDIQGAKILHRYGIPIGHIGHLNQVPRHEVAAALAMRPEVFTVFSFEMASTISRELEGTDRVQKLLLRVVGEDDLFFEGQEGGIPETELLDVARRIATLDHVEITGTVSFPCIRYNPTRDVTVEPTPNFRTIVRAARALERDRFTVTQINAPGNTSSQTLAMIMGTGGTHAEPGHGLLGTTPNHAFLEGLPERPSYVYVTEVSHFVGDQAYCFGGGIWSDIYDPNFVPSAVAGRDPNTIGDKVIESVPKKQIIDYHAILASKKTVQIGDTVMFGFRTQMQMTRSQVAVVGGVQSGNPELLGLFDHAGTLIDADHNPIASADSRASVASVSARYARSA